MLGRGEIAEMEVVVHEGAVASLGARLGDRDFWDLLATLSTAAGAWWGWSGVGGC